MLGLAMLLRALILASLALAPAEEPTSEPARIETIVGTGEAGFSGDGGPAARARLNQPFDVVYDRAGNLYLSDTGNQRIRRVDASGVITTVAGNGGKGFAGDGGPATAAKLDEPYGMAIDGDGNLYFADRLNRRVRRVDGRSGIITTVAGDGGKATSGDGGPGPDAGIVEPNDVALDGRGRLFIADVSGHRVRVVDLATGRIATFAGDGRGRRAGDGGPAATASFFGPRAVEALADGSLLILERNGHALRSVAADGTVSTIAGGSKGYRGDGGPARDAAFDGPKELDAGPNGDLLIVDTENHAIRRIDAKTHEVSTVAGRGVAAKDGDGGPAAAAGLARPHGVAFGPDGRSFVIGDTENHRIRRVVPVGR
ncbi:SMP-30/gluconolactonase/LRE family protein [Paludisphaera mucosa]|uniref:SMP-30/gluconolactonase/LRE family protein n=1 Tax=Paludisphaera mucosa TaxID=3030827 RepID=A0ABT6F453_9BACT|nr:SMP-30/gluconolactonase/LRE family protein [Paludisphaera mucosa]MDG3002361.1 SMP-30/gluconolactonase/LRE family protein [Paludisphaera mucosa]